VTHLSRTPKSHDPYWDLDGTGVRRTRAHRKVVKRVAVLVGILLIALAVTRLPPIDPTVLTSEAAKPLIAAALLALLGASVLLGLARMRYVSRH
jgi:uncharacterized integral membrane protein